MKKKIIPLLLIISLVSTVLCPAVLAASYDDISGHWAEQAINTYSDYGIIKGADGLFRPDDTITRAELSIMMDRLFKYSEKAENSFKDLPDNAWYTDAVLKANAAEIILGSDGYIRPLDTITRQEAAVIVARAFALNNTGVGLDVYEDSGSIASWASDAISALTAEGYLNGVGDYFQPDANLKRAEIVALLDNIIERIFSYGGMVTKNGRLLYNSLWHNIFDNLAVNTYADRGIFSNENGRMNYTSNGVSALQGIDVSFYQGDIVWERVANAGIDFAFIRLGNRFAASGSIALDTKYVRNMQGATATGIDRGVYFFSQAISPEEAVEEAKFVISNLSGYDITYPVVFDWEPVDGNNSRTKNMTPAMLNQCAIAFCETVAAAGYQPMVYTNKWYGMSKFNLGQLAAYDLWFAGYQTPTPTLYYEMDIWQYSSTGHVDGIKGYVDMNLSFVDYPGGTSRFK